MGEHDEQIVFEIGYNKGFKDGIKGSIPKAEVKKFLEEGTKNVSNNVLAIVREDYIHKADYEARLKADMIAMLTDIQFEIEELDLKDSIPDYTSGAEDTRDYITNMIEETIDKLKGV